MRSREGKPTEEWVFGDGGPVVLLQSAAVGRWNGAPVMDESDYDIICAVDEGVQVITHLDRDMIVLSDSEWAAKIVDREDGLFIFQSLGHDGTPAEIIDSLIAGEPESVFGFTQIDASVRLMVGADTAANPIYDYTERPLAPGVYRVRSYASDEAYVARLTPVQGHE